MTAPYRSCLLLPLLAVPLWGADTLDLSGTWRFALDRKDAGAAEQWPARKLADTLQLPGDCAAQGFGDAPSTNTPWIGGIIDKGWYHAPEYAPYRQPGNVKVPFWLTPERRYQGAAWYQRDIEIPGEWKDRRLMLSLERPHWQTTVWIDDRCVGTNDSLSVAHAYDLGTDLAPGRHTLTIRVDNRMIVDVGENSHSVSDHMQGNWNGIVGRIELRSTPPVWIEDVQLYPGDTNGLMSLKVRIGNATGRAGEGQIAWGTGGEGRTRFSGNTGLSWSTNRFTDLDLGASVRAPLWDEFSPALADFQLTITLPGGDTDTRSLRIGSRQLATTDTHFTLNGRPIFLRGTLDCCTYPATGYPPTDTAGWRRVIRICKAHGLNHIRFHSWCPPEAAFVAADEEGFYFQVECGSWANQSTTIGDGKPIDAWIYAEADRILKAYGNHPSFLLMPYGNEPGGKNHSAFLGKWVAHYKAKDPRRLYTTAAGWPERPENDYHNVPQPRIQGWGQGLGSRINGKPPETTTDYRDFVQRRKVPVVSHEIGQWCVFPNFDEIPKYTGVLKARNFEIFRDFLATRGMGPQAREFLMASGFQQVLCYKEEIESALRTPGFGGFQLLDLHDFPGQGTALVGILDPFWDSKPYCTPEQFARFCGPTVPLARMAKRTWTAGETFAADVEISHFGKVPMVGRTVTWKFQSLENGINANGSFADVKLDFGNAQKAGRIEVPLAGVKRAAMAKLTVRIDELENDWDVWVYPAQVDTNIPAGVTVAASLDEALPVLRSGARVLLAVDPRTVKTDVALGFSSVFWNTAWTGGQPPHTLGMVVRNEHPALADFPTENHSNWQWWEAIHGGAAMVLDDLPRDIAPIVQPIDTWFRNHKLALVFEAKVAGGSLLVCSANLDDHGGTRPAARQLKHSLLAYTGGGKFAPKIELAPEQVAALFRPLSRLQALGATAKADSAEKHYGPERAIDGDPATIWHTAWEPSPKPMPHELVIDLKGERSLSGVRYLPRQDMVNGRIGKFEIRLSSDGRKWTEPVAAGQWTDSATAQTVLFPAQAARFLKIVALSEVQGKEFAAIAELDLIEGK